MFYPHYEPVDAVQDYVVAINIALLDFPIKRYFPLPAWRFFRYPYIFMPWNRPIGLLILRNTDAVLEVGFHDIEIPFKAFKTEGPIRDDAHAKASI